MKRLGVFLILIWIGGMVTNILGIWTIVEFILYLVKDDPFNWESLYWTISMLVFTLLMFVMNFFVMFNKKP